MKIYKVKVNDKVYEVQIESVTEQAGSIELRMLHLKQLLHQVEKKNQSLLQWLVTS